MNFYQKEISLKPFSRGFHLITAEIIKEFYEISNISIGQLQVFI
ncbi:MAG: YjbQ family protein, partial [Lutibacter sp.]